MSDTLIEFAQPFFTDLPDDLDVETHEKTLGIAVAVWNIVVMAEWEDPPLQPSDPEWLNLKAIRAAIESIRDIGDDSVPAEETTTVLRTMALRKRVMAPDDHRIVDRVTVRRKDDGVVVTAAAHYQERGFEFHEGGS